jgi:hypothetical protein
MRRNKACAWYSPSTQIHLAGRLSGSSPETPKPPCFYFVKIFFYLQQLLKPKALKQQLEYVYIQHNKDYKIPKSCAIPKTQVVTFPVFPGGRPGSVT